LRSIGAFANVEYLLQRGGIDVFVFGSDEKRSNSEQLQLVPLDLDFGQVNVD